MRRLDPTRPISDEDLWTILEASLKAPNGSNNQQMRWLIVRDGALRSQLGAMYELQWNANRTSYFDRPLMLSSGDHLAVHFGQAPVVAIPIAPAPVGGGSVYPAVQNLILAARGLGIGSVLTFLQRGNEDAIKSLLAIPDNYSVFGAIPLGYPLTKFSPPKRRPVQEVTFWDRFGELAPR